MKANDVISKLRDKFLEEISEHDGYIADDNYEVMNLLNDEAAHVKEVLGQETWVMSDDSYITRSGDEYWIGDDVTMFEIEEDLQK